LTRADELRSQLDRLSKDDSTERVDLLNKYIETTLFSGQARALLGLCEETNAMAMRLGYAHGEAYGTLHLGVAYWLVTRLELALATLMEADAIFRECDDRSGSAKARGIMAAVYRSLGDHNQAYIDGMEPIEFFAAAGDPVWEARARLSFAMTNMEIGKEDAALEHFEKALALRQDSDEQWAVGRALAGIGTVHARRGDHREALRYFLRSLKTCEASGFRLGEARALHELGQAHERLGDREKAREYYLHSLKIREEIDQREAQCTSLVSLGKLALKEDTEEALSFLERALKVAEDTNAQPRIYQAHLALSEVYESIGDVENTLKHYKAFHEAWEQVSQFKSKMLAKNLTTIFEVEKKAREKEIAQLKESLGEGASLGSYQLKKKLGAGGMGEVWLGQHRLLARPAAVKVIRGGGSDSTAYGELVERFKREAEVTSSLRSPHTVQLFDFGASDSGTFHYVMELLDGMDVRQMVERFGPVRPERLIWLLKQACRSLAEAHEKGLIHRDIKPANLFVSHLGGEYDFLKVLDFGMVRADPAEGDPNLTAEGSFVGTPAFVAPEFVTGEGPTDGRADLYSLGCTAFWALTAKPVFEGNTPTAVLLNHVQAVPVPVSQLSERDIPEELERVIMQCLSKKPEERPASASALWESLTAIELEHPWDQGQARKWWTTHVPEMFAKDGA